MGGERPRAVSIDRGGPSAGDRTRAAPGHGLAGHRRRLDGRVAIPALAHAVGRPALGWTAGPCASSQPADIPDGCDPCDVSGKMAACKGTVSHRTHPGFGWRCWWRSWAPSVCSRSWCSTHPTPGSGSSRMRLAGARRPVRRAGWTRSAAPGRHDRGGRRGPRRTDLGRGWPRRRRPSRRSPAGLRPGR